MEVYDAMRTTFAAREYTDVEVSDETLYRILDNARFAPSGGNRQGWKVLVVKDRRIRLQLKEILGQRFVNTGPVKVSAKHHSRRWVQVR